MEMETDTDADVDEPNDNNGLDDNHIECTQLTSEDAPTSIEDENPRKAKDKAASSNGLKTPDRHQPPQIYEEPLNLTTYDWDKPLDLSVKNSK